MAEWQALLIAIVTSGALSAVISGWISRRKVHAEAESEEADAADKITASSLALVTRWEGRVVTLECELAALRKRVRSLEDERDTLFRGASKLQGQVMALGHDPVWRVESLQADSGKKDSSG